MVTSTRSGQLKKDESASKSNGGNAGRKEKGIKGSTGSTRSRSAIGKGNGGKGLTASGSSTDSSTSRKSTGQAPVNNVSRSPNTRRSKRLATCESSVSLDERDSERIEGGSTQSPLRRSKRIKEHAASSPSGLIESKRNQKNIHEGGKLTVADIGGEKSNMKPDVKPANLVSQKKRRLDARSYRALLKSGKSQNKSAEDIDVRGSQENGDSLPHPESFIPRAGDSEDAQELEELRDEKEEMIEEHDPGEFVRVLIEGSSPISRELGNRTLEDHTEGESAYLEGKQKICSDEMNESGHEGSCSDNKCIDSSLQSSSRGAIARRIDDDTERSNCFARGVLQTPDLTASISEGKQTDVESHDAVGSLQSVKINLDHHSAVSVAPVNPVVLISEALTADIISSSSGNKDQFIELCTVCCKQQRASNNLKAHDFCSCDGNFISFSQGGCVPQTVPESYKDEMMACSGKDDSAKSSEHKGRGKSTKSQREVILTDVPNLFHASLTIEEDRGLEVTDSVDSTGEPNTEQKGSSWAIQPNASDNACVICKRPGHLLCCDGKGCKRSYHLSCIAPPLREVPPGIWHCPYCIRKKIELGFHSVSEGMESVLDARLVDSTYSGGTRKEKQYLVKYKGLAHVHNCWVPEREILLEAPSLLGKFNRRNQREKVTLWKEEWTVPQRLLQKRLLMQPELANECFSGCVSNARSCYYEWLVKWTGLGYEHVTWEFENSSFLSTPEAMALIRDFESRHRNAKKSSDPSKADKAKLRRQVPLSQLPALPDSCPTGLNGDYLNSVNKLRECRHKAQSVLFLDEQERIIKVILFILSMEPDVSRPFLLISTSISLSLWEAEFRRLAPSVNVVVYSGNKDVRKMIRSLEFYEEGGCIKFQVLLSLPHAIVEDYEALDCIGWEALVVDDCQHLRVSKHLEQLKKLSCDFRLILLNGQLKDNIPEYLNLLSFLDSGSQCFADGMNVTCNSNTAELAIVRDRLSKYIAHSRKADCSKFFEYWVPVELSTVQLEQYCATLISHSLSVRSCSKIDHVGVLRDILISLRKCCDHPYLVDEFLQAKLTKDLQATEYLDIGVKASGKLQLLDRILQEMKDQGHRLVILFQLVGRDRKSTIGDILDDFLRQRFGVDSYERVDSGLSMPKKQSALNMFNSKENGRFVFLIENRACLPSIRLSSVDAAIIFSSDWNPASDLRALQKISIDSLSGYVKVFRLYSSFTVEEKVLILAKQDKTLESNIPNISCSVSQSLLSWGASYIFSKLDEFHRSESPKICSVSFSDKSILNDVLAEFLQNAGRENTKNCSIISKAQQSGAGYSRDILLLGEKEMPFPNEEPSHVFWSRLLDGRYPRWRFISEPSQRARRKPPYPGTLLQQPEVENDEARKKRRKVVNSSGDLKTPDEHECIMKSKSFGSLKETKITPVDLTKGPGVPRNKVHIGQQFSPSSSAHKNDVYHNQDITLMPDSTSAGIQMPAPESEERGQSHSSQRNLHLLLKPELTKLCEALRLSADVSNMAQLCLEYIMNNHRVSREPETILQAFKIALCWRAASIVKPKLDHRTALFLAKKYLNYGCTEEEAESVYSKLRMLKKKFKRYASRNVVELNSHSQGNDSSPRKEIESEFLHEKNPVPAAFDRQELEEGEIKGIQNNHRCSEWPFLPEQDQRPALEVPPVKHQMHIGPLNDEILNKRISLIEKTCSKRTEKLLHKQQLEVEEFNSFRESEKAKQQKAHELELDLICTIHLSCEVKKEKLNLLKQEFSNRMEKFEEHMKGQRRKLAVMQVEARTKEQQIRDCWLAEANVGRLAESFDKIPLADTGFTPDEFKDAEQHGSYDGLRNVLSVCGHPIEYESTCSAVYGQSDSTHQDNTPADFPPPLSRGTAEDLPGAVMVILPDRHAMENNTECAPASTSFEIQGTSPSVQALSNSDYDYPPLSHQVPSNQCERPSPLDRFDSGWGLNSSQPVTTATLQSSDCVPAQLLPSDGDLMVHDSVPLLPQVCSDLPSVQRGISCTSGATESRQELSFSRAVTIPSTQSEDEHGSDMNCSTNPAQLSVQESIGTTVSLQTTLDGLESRQRLNSLHSVQKSIGTRVNSQTTTIDGLESGQRLNSLHANTLPSSQESFEIMVLQTEPSDQLIEQTAVLDGLGGVLELNSSQNSSQEIMVSSLELQATVDLSSGQCDIAHACTPGQNRDEFTSDTCRPTDQIQISARQSFGAMASQAGHSDIACPPRSAEVGQELNSCHDTSLQISGTTDATDFSYSNPFAHQVQLSPDHSFGTTSSQAGQTIVGTQNCYVSIPHGRMEYPTSTTHESNNHLLLPSSMVPQASLHDPLQNELNKIRKEEDRDAEMCEKEKQRLKSELEKELEKVRKKYDSLLNDVETKFVERKKTFGILYNKVYLNRVLAEEFRLKFAESKALAAGASSQGTRPSFMQQLVHASHPQVSHREALASASAATSLVSPGFVRAPAAVSHFDLAFSSARTRVPSPVVCPASVSSGPPVQVVHHSSALFSSNPPVRHLSPILPPRGSFQVGSERAPAPHLHPFRANASMSASNFPLRPGGSLNQQQLPSHSISSMPLQVVNTSLAFQSMDAVGGTQRQENLSMRPVFGASQSTPSLAADVRDECAGINVPNLLPSLELDQRRSFDHASTGTGQPPPSAEAAIAPPQVICLLDD